MPSIVFKTNAINRLVDGRENNTSLCVTIDSDQITDLQQLNRILIREINKHGVHVQIKALFVNKRPIVHISELNSAGKGSDFSVEVIELTQHEMDALKKIRELDSEIKGIHQKITAMSLERESLIRKLENSSAALKLLIGDNQSLQDEKNSLLQILSRVLKKKGPVVQQPSTAPVSGGNKDGLFASNPTVVTIKPTISPLNLNEVQLPEGLLNRVISA